MERSNNLWRHLLVLAWDQAFFCLPGCEEMRRFFLRQGDEKIVHSIMHGNWAVVLFLVLNVWEVLEPP